MYLDSFGPLHASLVWSRYLFKVFICIESQCATINHLCFIDKPRINRVVSNFTLTEHSFQLFSCSVISGRKSFLFTWKFANRQLHSNGNIKVESSDNFSFLSLQSVHRNESGDYICIAQNDEGFDSVTFHLNVNGDDLLLLLCYIWVDCQWKATICKLASYVSLLQWEKVSFTPFRCIILHWGLIWGFRLLLYRFTV